MNIDHIDINLLREVVEKDMGGYPLKEEELRNALGIYWRFPKEVKALTKMINHSINAQNNIEMQEMMKNNPEEVRVLLSQVFS